MTGFEWFILPVSFFSILFCLPSVGHAALLMNSRSDCQEHEVYRIQQHYLDRCRTLLNQYEIDTFVCGVSISSPDDIADDEMQALVQNTDWDIWKAYIKRETGRELERTFDVEVDYHSPDIRLILDLASQSVHTDITSLYIAGRYNKYSRQLPQTVFHCRTCRGSGCSDCNGTGKAYTDSVQGLIQEPFVRAARAERGIFHGAGREDIDAKCFGGRKFVLELTEPEKRSLSLHDIQQQVNSADNRVEIFDLDRTEKSRVQEIKEEHEDKTYRARVVVETPVKRSQLRNLSTISGTVHQYTPRRVSHRRSERERTRTVYRVVPEVVHSPRKFDLLITAEAGTYIKEFISGDEGRTEPDVSSFLDAKASCRYLDVLWFGDWA